MVQLVPHLHYNLSLSQEEQHVLVCACVLMCLCARVLITPVLSSCWPNGPAKSVSPRLRGTVLKLSVRWKVTKESFYKLIRIDAHIPVHEAGLGRCSFKIDLASARGQFTLFCFILFFETVLHYVA